MAKDESLLSGVSDLFTEETLKDILRNVSGENEVQVSGWDFGEASNKGDGYLSVANRVRVTGVAGDKPVEISLVVKSMPRNISRRKTLRSTDFFYNEITFYKEIFPKLDEFLKSKNQSDLIVVPRCLAAVTDGENDFIALEDVSVLGFGPITRQNTLTLSQCSVILESLARFHAVSFAYKDQRAEEFKLLSEKLLETFFTTELFSWYKTFQALLLRVAKDALAQEYPGSEGEMRFNSYSGQELYNKSLEFCSRVNAPTSVISHGDVWAPNFLIRASEASKNCVALMLDFQLSRCASPVLDTSFFIYTCTEKKLRDNHYEELLKIYHRELSRSISLLGSDPQKLYPWEVFIKEVQEQSLHGINAAVEAVPFSMMDSSEAFDLDILKGNEAVDTADIFDVKPIKTKEGRRRLADVILHAVEKNYL